MKENTMKGLRSKILHNTALLSIAVFINLLALALFIEFYKKSSHRNDGMRPPLVSANKISADVKIPIRPKQPETAQKDTKHNPPRVKRSSSAKVEVKKETKKKEPVKPKRQLKQKAEKPKAPPPKKPSAKKLKPLEPPKPQTGNTKIAVGAKKQDGKPVPNITQQAPDIHKDTSEQSNARISMKELLEQRSKESIDRSEDNAQERMIHQQNEASETVAQRTVQPSATVKSEASQSKNSQTLTVAENKKIPSVSPDKSEKNPMANVNEGIKPAAPGTNASAKTFSGQPAHSAVRSIRATRLHNAYRGRLVRAGMQGLTNPDGVKAPLLSASDVDRMMLRQFGFKLVAYCNVDEELKLRFVIDPNTGDYTPLKKDKSVTYSKRGIGVSKQSFPLLYDVGGKIANTHNILSDDIAFFYLVPVEIDAYIYAKQMQMVKAAGLETEDPSTLITHGEWYVGNGKLMLIITEIETSEGQFISVRDFELQF